MGMKKLTTKIFRGSQAKVAVKTNKTVAFMDHVQVNLIKLNYGLKKGLKYISGTITRKYGSGNFSATGMTFKGCATESGVKTEFWIAIFPEGKELPKTLLSNATFCNWRLNNRNGYDQGTLSRYMVYESMDFSARTIEEQKEE